ncbi:hypothetical protein [Candidatus Electronema sp. JM]|uniref:hypothetical protein n=1 Tax=Candidatus Electronema sp. JM TaxID=3401571 RepID=UPI003AA86D79
MNAKKWIRFFDSAEVDASPAMEVSKSLRTDNAEERTVLTVRYSVRGAWEGVVGDFQKVKCRKQAQLKRKVPLLYQKTVFLLLYRKMRKM